MKQESNYSLRILMVCLGNICRSPIADGLLRRKVKENNLNILVDSAGTAAYHIGKAPDSRMCSTAEEFGTNIKNLVARKFTINDFDDFDNSVDFASVETQLVEKILKKLIDQIYNASMEDW